MDDRSGYDRNYGKFINTQVAADWTLPWMKEVIIGAMFNYRLNDSHTKKFSTKAPQYYQDGTIYRLVIRHWMKPVTGETPTTLS